MHQPVPAPLLERLSDPQVLLSPAAPGGIRSGFAQLPNGPALFHQVITALRASLGAALQDVFLVGTVIALASVVASLFLPEIPLRQGYGPPQRAAAEPAGLRAMGRPAEMPGGDGGAASRRLLMLG